MAQYLHYLSIALGEIPNQKLRRRGGRRYGVAEHNFKIARDVI